MQNRPMDYRENLMMKIVRFFLLQFVFTNFVSTETIKLNIDLSVNQLIEAVQLLSPKDRLKVNKAIWN